MILFIKCLILPLVMNEVDCTANFSLTREISKLHTVLKLQTNKQPPLPCSPPLLLEPTSSQLTITTDGRLKSKLGLQIRCSFG